MWRMSKKTGLETLGMGMGRGGLLDKETLAVLSHGLLGSVASLMDAADRLATAWPGMDDRERAILLDALRVNASWIGDVLEGLVRGLPADVVSALEHQADV